MELSEIRIGKPTKDVPASGRLASVEPDEITRRLVMECMGLKPGEYLPIECADKVAAARLGQRAHGGAIKKYGIGSKVRGTTVYFYRNGTH